MRVWNTVCMTGLVICGIAGGLMIVFSVIPLWVEFEMKIQSYGFEDKVEVDIGLFGMCIVGEDPFATYNTYDGCRSLDDLMAHLHDDTESHLKSARALVVCAINFFGLGYLLSIIGAIVIWRRGRYSAAVIITGAVLLYAAGGFAIIGEIIFSNNVYPDLKDLWLELSAPGIDARWMRTACPPLLVASSVVLGISATLILLGGLMMPREMQKYCNGTVLSTGATSMITTYPVSGQVGSGMTVVSTAHSTGPGVMVNHASSTQVSGSTQQQQPNAAGYAYGMPTVGQSGTPAYFDSRDTARLV